MLYSLVPFVVRPSLYELAGRALLLSHSLPSRWNGQRAMFVTVAVQTGRNVSTVKQAVWAELDQLERALPKGVTLARGFDQSHNVDARLGRLGEDFAIAIALVLITLLPLGVRASLVVMISIPLSLALAVVMLNATGFSINQLSIVGFVIALGLLVDDSIVLVENITRFMRAGVPRREAAIVATKQIAIAVLGATATLIFAFVPLLFLPGLSGRYIRSLPIAVVYAVLSSLLVSLTIIPWLSSRLLSNSTRTVHTGGLFGVTHGDPPSGASACSHGDELCAVGLQHRCSDEAGAGDDSFLRFWPFWCSSSAISKRRSSLLQ